jgi:hypothetical protein
MSTGSVRSPPVGGSSSSLGGSITSVMDCHCSSVTAAGDHRQFHVKLELV